MNDGEVVRLETPSASNIAIRVVTGDDLAGLGEINVHGFSGNKPEGSGEAWMRSYYDSEQFRVWVAEIEGKLAGYIVWRILGGFNREYTTTELEQLAVSSEFRKRGVADTLIEDTLDLIGLWIREKNVTSGHIGQIVVWVDAGNVAALAAYAKCFPTFGGHRCEYMRNGSRLEEVQRKGSIPIPRLRLR